MNTFEKGYALLIGVSDQKNKENAKPLPETENDVKKLAAILLDPEKSGYQEDKVKILLGKEATTDNIIDQLIWLKKSLEKEPEATAIIYFSGHGYRKEEDDKYYLIPYNFNIDMPDRTAIEDREFSKIIGQMNAQRMLLLMDCCHAGETDAFLASTGFSQSAANVDRFLSRDNSKPIVEDEKPEDNDPGSKPIIEDEKPEDNDPGSKPIVEDEKPEDNDPGSKPIEDEEAIAAPTASTSAVLVSSRGSELSFIHKTAEMSLFTYHLIEALNGHGKSKKEDTVVNVLDIMSHVLDSVPRTAEEQGVKQTPNARYNGENFPIALLMGGAGIPENQEAPKVEEVMQNIRTINVDGDGNVVADNINTGGGDFNVDNSQTTTETNIGGNNFAGASFGGGFTGGDNITTGNISGNNTQVGGRNNLMTVTTNENTLDDLFKEVYDKIDAWPANHEAIDKEELKDTTEKIKEEIQKDQPNESKLKRWMGTLKDSAPDILDTIASIIANPSAGIAAGIRMVSERLR